ncbi:hypothetical protein DWU89_05890 [Parabacteroides acidifaciens]|uniref:Uncharacterized protein n=1 Tax=Parabacteroides acidifaciens TaxID=2290935 RepID=A0A3D8HGJ7_9BACT|nr:hypothetical protein DWU89_05890 [Parabacteroides acidifaciens]
MAVSLSIYRPKANNPTDSPTSGTDIHTNGLIYFLVISYHFAETSCAKEWKKKHFSEQEEPPPIVKCIFYCQRRLFLPQKKLFMASGGSAWHKNIILLQAEHFLP